MKILFVSLFLPQKKATHAGGRYVYELLANLSLNHEIHLATRFEEGEEEGLEALAPLCRKVHSFRYPRIEKRGLLDNIGLVLNYLRFSRFADRLIATGDYDLVQVEWVETALLIRKRGTPMVLDAHDVITKPAFRRVGQARGRAKLVRTAAAALTRMVEIAVVSRFDRVITLSEFDRQYLRNMMPGVDPVVASIPAGLDLTDRSYHRDPNTLLFLASYRSRQINVEAVLYFYRNILPLIRREIPEARFVIAGYGPPEELTRLAEDPYVSVPGFVDDLDACHKRAAVFVAPILAGGGIIMKILDAMAAGTPVVTTSFGNEGVGGAPGRALLIGDTPEAFAEGVVSLLRDPARAREIGENGRRHVEAHFGLQRTMKTLEHTYDAVVREAKMRRNR